eukprot:6200381-Pleurochrysis_carterae.AAC.2
MSGWCEGVRLPESVQRRGGMRGSAEALAGPRRPQRKQRARQRRSGEVDTKTDKREKRQRLRQQRKVDQRQHGGVEPQAAGGGEQSGSRNEGGEGECRRWRRGEDAKRVQNMCSLAAAGKPDT